MQARVLFVTACLAAQVTTTASSRAQPVGEDEPATDTAQDDAYADNDPSALTEFRGALDPYGSWTDDPTYGTVWTPSANQVDTSFQPYETAGSWDYIDGDYVWVSEYPWGWVCFHYGRWALSASRWVWIPGRVYAGAWVSWRVGDEGYRFIAWAPMAPAWGWMSGNATALGFSSFERWVSSSYGALFSSVAGWSTVSSDQAATFAAHTRRYVPARPAVVQAQASEGLPHGPPPSTLGIDVSRFGMRALSASELRARTLARPSTAQTLGARPPALVRPVARPSAAPPAHRPDNGARGPARPHGR